MEHCRGNSSDKVPVEVHMGTKNPLVPCPYRASCNGCASKEKRGKHKLDTQHSNKGAPVGTWKDC